jgi:hypothetical protein
MAAVGKRPRDGACHQIADPARLGKLAHTGKSDDELISEFSSSWRALSQVSPRMMQGSSAPRISSMIYITRLSEPDRSGQKLYPTPKFNELPLVNPGGIGEGT